MKRAVSNSYFLFSLIFIAILASLFVIADAITTNDAPTVTSANLTNTTVTTPTASIADTLPAPALAILHNMVPANTTLQTADLTAEGKPLSTPMQAINACRTTGDCTTTGYLTAAQAIINTTGYNCTITDDGKIYLTCDSMYDGNGDGKCTSGESCIQFGIVGNYITRKERNSQDTWQDHDTTYTMKRAEVAQ
jgi:hypothetical protein